MSTLVLNRGFPVEWKSGNLEKEIFDTLKRNIDQTWPTDFNFIINPTFVNLGASPEIMRFCMDQHPDRVFISSMTDPLAYTAATIRERFPDLENVIKFGYFSGEYEFDFWAMACGRYFKHYTEDQLELRSPKYLFVNYNRKPHHHRQELARALVNSGLDYHGVLTLGKYDTDRYNFEIYRTLDETVDEYAEWGATDINGDVGIPNDVYSLGRLDIWQNHLVNVVSETEFVQDKQVFVSEKIWKPIIGMRPFMVNSAPRVNSWLKERGFDTFEDVWLDINYNNSVNAVVSTIVYNLSWLNTLNSEEKMQWFEALKPRLRANRQRFFDYVLEQEEKVSKLFLK